MPAPKRPVHKKPYGKERFEAEDDRAEVKVHGINACLALAKNRRDDIVRMFVNEDQTGPFSATLKWCAAQKIVYRVIPDEELERVSGSTHHEGVCIIAKELPFTSFQNLLATMPGSPQPLRLVYLDGVENPHNVGAIARVCAHFGVSALLLPKESTLTTSGALHRVSEGAIESLPLVKCDGLKAVLTALRARNIQSYGTIVDGTSSLYTTKLASRALFVFGSEGDGMSSAARQLLDVRLTIPGSGVVESLNVATSCAAILGEHFRQAITN